MQAKNLEHCVELCRIILSKVVEVISWRRQVADVTKLAGTIAEGWYLEHELGFGADGFVYAGSKNGRNAAIKLFFPESLEKNGLAEARERLEFQLSLVGQKHHPNLVEIYEGGDCAEHKTMYLAMELIPGKSLDKLIGSVPLENVPGLLRQLSGATRHLEEKLELFHRDIKPANIVVSEDFTMLTLLDLGVVYRFSDDAADRLSGDEFVATLRYSPPEFVWRTEESNEDGAWRAITFYQLGATLHDLLVGKPLFHGQDTPRARLYDCVRDKTPDISVSAECPAWLVQLAQACLLKDWRSRLQFVSWDSFNGPSSDSRVVQRERSIRLKQLRNEEVRMAAAKNPVKTVVNTRERDLWQLNSALFGEMRTYLLDSIIFPKFRAVENAVSDQEYNFQFEFEMDANKDFALPWTAFVSIKVASIVREATELRFFAKCGDVTLSEATWAEMFTVETALANCQQLLLDAVDKLLSQD